MFDFIRVSCAVPAIAVADVAGNAGKMKVQLQHAAEQGSNIVVFPELSLTGYTCQDLFFQETLLEDCKAALEDLAAYTGVLGLTAVVGAPISIRGQLYNCAVVLDHGDFAGIVPKQFLPNYGEYYEKRWFSPAENLPEGQYTSVRLGGDDVIGNRQMLFQADDVTFGVELCEDLWTPLPPSTFLTMNGAELILNLSASNEVIAKRQYRRELVSQQSARCLCAYAYCSAGSTESTQDLVFSGHSMIAENGAILAENEKLLDTDYVLTMDIDLGKIRADRRKNRSFADTAKAYGRTDFCPVELLGGQRDSDGALYPLKKLPFVPASRQDRQERCRSIFQMQVAGLKKRLDVTGAKPVIGVSGGLDSTLALLVAAEAVFFFILSTRSTRFSSSFFPYSSLVTPSIPTALSPSIFSWHSLRSFTLIR